MRFGALKLAGSAIVAAVLLAPAAASAQSYFGARYAYADGGPQRDRDGYPRAGSSRDGYYEERRAAPPPRPTAYRERRQRCRRGDAGTILGAIAGGLLGDSAVERHRSRPAGTNRGFPVGNAADGDCD
jgi:hypothetical protein